MRELQDRRDGGRVIATRRHFWRLLGRAIDRDTASEAVTVMIVADDAGDDPLADRREDLEAVAERERKAKVAKLKSQTERIPKLETWRPHGELMHVVA